MTALALAPLTREAAAGCEDAWRDLIGRFDPMLRGIVRGYRLDDADVEDVVQTTWIRAYRNLDRLNEPGAVGAWLAITARREHAGGAWDGECHIPQSRHHRRLIRKIGRIDRASARCAGAGPPEGSQSTPIAPSGGPPRCFTCSTPSSHFC